MKNLINACWRIYFFIMNVDGYACQMSPSWWYPDYRTDIMNYQRNHWLHYKIMDDHGYDVCNIHTFVPSSHYRSDIPTSERRLRLYTNMGIKTVGYYKQSTELNSKCLILYAEETAEAYKELNELKKCL